MKKKPEKFSYTLRLHEVDTNTKMLVHYTPNGARLWDWLATRGYVMLVPYAGASGGYYYEFAKLKEGIKKAYEEGLTKLGGLFYEERYYY